MNDPTLRCSHCDKVIPGYDNAGWASAYAWWCARCITEHGKVLPQFGLPSTDPSNSALHWGSDSDKLRSIPKYDNIVL